MFEFKPDYARSKQRIDAFWACEVLDRPVVQFGLAKPPEQRVPLPASHHSDPAARWLDTQYQTEQKLATLSNREFLGDTLPIAYPNVRVIQPRPEPAARKGQGMASSMITKERPNQIAARWCFLRGSSAFLDSE